jgi:hypothetical protein
MTEAFGYSRNMISKELLIRLQTIKRFNFPFASQLNKNLYDTPFHLFNSLALEPCRIQSSSKLLPEITKGLLRLWAQLMEIKERKISEQKLP